MSEIITSANLDTVIQMNREIEHEVTAQAMRLQTNPSIMKVASMPQLALLILQGYGLIQMPIEDRYLSGAIYVKDGKQIPMINTALPRANQYFTAWHEVYHLIFDQISFDHFIENNQMVEERKAEYFASKMLLQGVELYFTGLSDMDNLQRAFFCMSVFQAPYKAVLISLYEYALKSGNDTLKRWILDSFDLRIDDIAERFRELGLDDSLVLPSYVVNTSYLMGRIREQKIKFPDLKYHAENEEYLENVLREIRLIERAAE